jgi:hypothetical protein
MLTLLADQVSNEACLLSAEMLHGVSTLPDEIVAVLCEELGS